MMIISSSKASILQLKQWKPDPASLREEIWFDDINKYLYIDFRKTCATCLKIATWDNGLYVERWNQVLETWESEEWDPGIPIPLPKAGMVFSLDEFFSDIPKEVIRAITPFKWRQFVLLRMIRHFPETMELLQSNPLLAWFCADSIAEIEIPVSEVRNLLMKKRRDICGFIGLSSTDAMVKLLGKMRAEEYSQELLNDLKSLLHEKENVIRLRHVKHIPADEILNLYSRFDYMIWALSTVDKNGKTVWSEMLDSATKFGYRIWSDTKALGKDLCVDNPQKRMSLCKTFRELHKLHNDWSAKLSIERAHWRAEEFFKEHGTYSFPNPPIAGDLDIVPITTISDLLNEGADMRHCVGSYADSIMDGDCYIYQVLKPQRATLEITKSGEGMRISQLKLICNGEPSLETWSKVKMWLTSALSPAEQTRLEFV